MAIKLIIVSCLVITLAHAGLLSHPDYCQDNYNCKGDKHTGCNNPLWNVGFGQQCKNATFSEISCELEDKFIDTLNKHRNQIALGNTPHFDKAKRMATIQWDWDLHDIAALWARECIFEHDKCRNTAKFPYSGQSIAIVYEGNKKFDSDEHYAAAAVDAWFAEAADNGAKYGYMDIINKYVQTDPNYEVGHFAQIVMEGAYRVGCAQTKYITKLNGDDKYTTLTVCNYASTPMLDYPIYTAGEAASGCQTGKNSEYPGLCSESEKYNTN